MSHDDEMLDATTGGAEIDDGVEEEQEEELVIGKQRLKLLRGSTDTAASFAFEKEDHTLGNALRYIISKNPDVEFVGYSIPHPSEPSMNLRIQTWDDVSVFDVLRKGLQDLADMCDVIEEKFVAARDDFKVTNPDGGPGRKDELRERSN